MAQTRPCDVSPTGDQDKYSMALVKQSGEWWGLDVPLFQIHPSTVNPPAPIQRVAQNSYHMGRGVDRFQPESYAFYDAYNGWSTTPGKFHATMLQRWAKGLRNADFNMPDARQVVWRPLVGTTRYLSVSFVASATYTAQKVILYLRRQVPAGTVAAPGTFTFELCANSGVDPGAVVGSGTATITPTQITDVVSQYVVLDITSALVSGTTYHVKVYGDSTDKSQACWEIATDPGVAGKRSSNNSSWTATTYSPYYRITDADTRRQFKTFVFDGSMYLVSLYDDETTASRLYINGVRGRATGVQTSLTLRDTSGGSSGASGWATNQFAGAYIRIIRGPGRGQVRQIESNTGNTITVTQAWDDDPVNGSSQYVVYSCDWFREITGTGLGVVTAPPVIQNAFVYFPQGDSTVIRKMRLNYSDADCHEFSAESASKNNKAAFLETAYDTNKGEPIIWRANQTATSGSTPNGKGVSVSNASSAPSGIAIPWATDLTFANSILCGDNTSSITNIYEHENNLYVAKEDGLYLIQGNRAVRVRLGVETAPDIDNGRAICTGGDKNLYMSFRNDVYMIAGGGSYPTGIRTNLPSERSGRIFSLIAAEGWLFAAINRGGATGLSSVMKYSLDSKSWSEQLRGFAARRKIQNLQWQPCPETRPRLWIDIQGEMMCQEFPIDGTRPYDDKELKYQAESDLTLSTVDLGSTDPKYFSVLTVTSQGLAEEIDLERGHVIVVECQTDNDIGTSKWEHVDYIRTSPTGGVKIERGNRRMLRIRLRCISNEPTDPVIIETIGLTLFTRNRLAHEYSVQFPILSDDEEQNSIDLLMALREMAETAQPLILKSRFTLFHDKFVTISDEPKYQISELEPEEKELEAQIWLKLTEVI